VEETEDTQVMIDAQNEVEAKLEEWVEKTDDELMDLMCGRAAAWAQAIAEFVMPVEGNEDRIETSINYDRRGVVISVRMAGVPES
jgi:hypothetical protein